MTTTEAEEAENGSSDPITLPIPQLPATGPKRPATLCQFARRIVQRLGAPAALLLAAELDEAVADVQEAGR